MRKRELVEYKGYREGRMKGAIRRRKHMYIRCTGELINPTCTFSETKFMASPKSNNARVMSGAVERLAGQITARYANRNIFPLNFSRTSIYYYFLFLWRCGPTRAMASSFLRFLDHKQRRTTVGRTLLDE